MKEKTRDVIIYGLVIVLCLFLVLFTFSYISFTHDRDAAKERLASSEIYGTPAGDIGFATRGEGMPVLIMHARDDALVNYTHALNAHEKIPDSRLILFDTGGHAMLSQIDPTREDIAQFPDAAR